MLFCHFGLNIWNHSRPIRKNRQKDIACFLKVIFARNLKDVELQTIKKKLTFNEGKYKIGLENEFV